jgi:hypothetical protein
MPRNIGETACFDPTTRGLYPQTPRYVQLPVHDRFHGVHAHAEIAGVKAAREAAGGADGLIALGGGSAIGTAKAVSSQTGLPIVSIPTTYGQGEPAPGAAGRSARASRGDVVIRTGAR